MINDKIYSLRKVPGCLQRHSMWSSNLIQLLPSASQRQNQFSGALTNIAVHIPINKSRLKASVSIGWHKNHHNKQGAPMWLFNLLPSKFNNADAWTKICFD